MCVYVCVCGYIVVLVVIVVDNGHRRQEALMMNANVLHVYFFASNATLRSVMRCVSPLRTQHNTHSRMHLDDNEMWNAERIFCC